MQKLSIKLAEKCAKYANLCGKSNILQTKPVHISGIEGLKIANVLEKDTVQISSSAKRWSGSSKQCIPNVSISHSKTSAFKTVDEIEGVGRDIFNLNCEQKFVEAEEPYKTLLVKNGDRQVISKSFREYMNNEEVDAFEDYIETYGHNIGLRRGENPNKFDLLMMSGLQKAPVLQQDAVVYRGVERLIHKSSQNFIESVEKGLIIKDLGFLSTSTNLTNIKNTIFLHNAINSDGLIMRIRLPKGTRGVLLDHNEYILPLNSKLYTNNIKMIGGLKVGDFTYILPE